MRIIDVKDPAEDQEDEEAMLVLLSMSLQIDPISFISSMDIERFEEWIRTDEYGNVQEKADKKDLEGILKLISNNPMMLEHEAIVLDMLIKG